MEGEKPLPTEAISALFRTASNKLTTESSNYESDLRKLVAHASLLDSLSLQLGSVGENEWSMFHLPRHQNDHQDDRAGSSSAAGSGSHACGSELTGLFGIAVLEGIPLDDTTNSCVAQVNILERDHDTDREDDLMERFAPLERMRRRSHSVTAACKQNEAASDRSDYETSTPTRFPSKYTPQMEPEEA